MTYTHTYIILIHCKLQLKCESHENIFVKFQVLQYTSKSVILTLILILPTQYWRTDEIFTSFSRLTAMVERAASSLTKHFHYTYLYSGVAGASSTCNQTCIPGICDGLGGFMHYFGVWNNCFCNSTWAQDRTHVGVHMLNQQSLHQISIGAKLDYVLHSLVITATNVHITLWE